MATRIKPQLFSCLEGIAPGAFKFPSGYKVKSRALGDTFPGFGPNVIPLTMQASASSNVTYNGVTAVSFSKSSGHSIWGSWYTKKNDWDESRGDFRANGLYLPYYFNYNFDAIKSAITTGTPLVWLDKTGGIDINPPKGKGWKFKSSRNGDVFPGFGENVIPVTMAVSQWASCSNSESHHGSSSGNTYASSSSTYKINSKEAVYVYIWAHAYSQFPNNESVYMSVSGDANANAVNIFLPYFYDFDYDALKAGVTSGTIIEWFQRG